MNQPGGHAHTERPIRCTGLSMYRTALRYALGIVAAMLLTTVGASAETSQQRGWCYGKGGATPEMQISGCSAFLAGGNHDDAAAADAFNNRGVGYAARQEWDRALTDY